MSRVNGLLLVALASLVVGLIGGAIAGSVTHREAQPMPPAVSITVPTGHVGDRVVYDHHKFDRANGTWQLLRRSIREIIGVESTPDLGGFLRDAARIQMTVVHKPPFLGSTSYELVDLEQRTTLRIDYTGPLRRNDEVEYYYSFHNWTCGARSWLFGTDFALQATTVRSGDVWSPSLVSRTYPVCGGYRNVTVEVTGPNTLGIDEVLGVNLTLSPPKGDLRLRVTSWVSARAPYPLLVQLSSIRGEGLVPLESMSLVEYSPGSTPIYWRPPQLQHPTPLWERAPATASASLQDGRSSRLPFLLSDAVANVGGDASLVRFQQWRSAHPGSRLVGATLMPESNPVPAHTWRLVFGLEDGSGYLVSSTMATDRAGLRTNRDLGELRLGGPFQRTLPAELITIASAERIWSAAAGPELARLGPNWVRWGFTEVSCCALIGPPSSANVTLRDVSTIRIGRMDIPAAGMPGAGDNVRSSLRINVANGEVMGGQYWAANRTIVPSGPAGQEARPMFPADATTHTVVSNPDLPMAAASSVAFLAILVYFFPLLKYLGMQGAVTVLGYAKLRRSKLLDHAARDKIMEAVRADPGVTPPQLMARTKLAWSTLVYHLGVLAKNRLVTSAFQGRHKRFFPATEVPPQAARRQALLRDPSNAALVGLVKADPGIVQRDLAARVQLSRPSTLHRLRGLEDAGLIVCRRVGRFAKYYPAQTPSA